MLMRSCNANSSSPAPHLLQATGVFVYREVPFARYFSFDHVEGCAGMKHRKNSASRGQLTGKFTCPIQHLSQVTSQKVKKLACKQSICGLYDPKYFGSKRRPKLDRPCWTKNVDECCAQPFDAWEPGWAPDIFPLCHGSGKPLDECLDRGNAKMKAYVESRGITYTHFATHAST